MAANSTTTKESTMSTTHNDVFYRISQMEAAAEGLGVSKEVIRVVARAIQAHDRAAEQIRDYGRTVTDRVERALGHVDEGYHVNSCGELQSVALSFDMACAVYESTADALRSVCALLPDEISNVPFEGVAA
jgi:hypothetical protein